ncbi:unnamed protein product [Caenorhabditis angaria]|uniref:Uncharacterized protein n=1 Tax=Caenorhabditis angaria TaxID=860376 RepID=A0A9P1I442_9PELO|nr:unnamed protein product [Caenorhabditis angaria]
MYIKIILYQILIYRSLAHENHQNLGGGEEDEQDVYQKHSTIFICLFVFIVLLFICAMAACFFFCIRRKKQKLAKSPKTGGSRSKSKSSREKEVVLCPKNTKPVIIKTNEPVIEEKDEFAEWNKIQADPNREITCDEAEPVEEQNLFDK